MGGVFRGFGGVVGGRIRIVIGGGGGRFTAEERDRRAEKKGF